jgi:hypothetical protein
MIFLSLCVSHIHTTYALFAKGLQWNLRYSSEMTMFYYACYIGIHINLPLESLYLLKETALISMQFPLGGLKDSMKDLSIHGDRQQEATLFYTML